MLDFTSNLNGADCRSCGVAMKMALLVAVAVPCAAFAARIKVPPMAMSPYADTEVSTNLPFRASDEDSRGMELQFALDGCVSNSVQVAFGRDENGDGVLGVDETETLYGWRNGRYFVESMTEGVRIEEADSSGATSCAFVMSLHLSKGRGLQHFSATNVLGTAILTNVSASAQSWLYQPDWNMMRVTRRGPGIPAEWFTCDVLSQFFYMTFR
jgi:hypothetical protein